MLLWISSIAFGMEQTDASHFIHFLLWYLNHNSLSRFNIIKIRDSSRAGLAQQLSIDLWNQEFMVGFSVRADAQL